MIAAGQAFIPAGNGDGDITDAWISVERTDVDEIAIEVYPRYGRERETTTIYLDRPSAGVVAAALLAEAKEAS